MEARDVLVSLAEELEGNGNQKEEMAAAQCLLAALSRGHQMEPGREARVRVRLGRLLLRNTQNVLLAKGCFDRAQVLIARKEEESDLRREALSGIASCYHVMGNLKQEKQALRKGAEESGGTNVKEWNAYFKVRLADALNTEGKFEEAMSELETMNEVCEEAKGLDLAAYKLHVALASSNLAWVQEKLGECSALANSMRLEIESIPAHSVVYFLFMTLLANQRLGNNNQVQTALKEISSFFPLQDSIWGRGWIPSAWIEESVSLVGIAHRSLCGELRQAVEQAKSSLEKVDAQLCKLGIGPTTKESHLNNMTIWTGRIWLVLQVNLIQATCLAQMTLTELPEAQLSLASLERIIHRYPVLLLDFKCEVHILSGLLHHSCMEYTEAVHRFQKARSCVKGAPLLNVAILLEAMSILCENGENACARVLDLMQTLQRASSGREGQTKALEIIVDSVTFACQGEYAEAKSLLKQGLKLAHTQLMNQQITAQVLNVLAMVSAAKDANIPITPMLESASTLSRNLNDLPMQLQTLHLTKQVLEKEGNDVGLMDCCALVEKHSVSLQDKVAQVKQQRQSEKAR